MTFEMSFGGTPSAMDLEDMYRQPYSGMAMQPYNGPPHSLPQGHQHYPRYWPQQQLLALYQPQPRAVLMMNHGNVPAPKQTESKPRLSKDEVELLEREFAKNPKPNSSIKRELAEQMAVEVPRINVGASMAVLCPHILTAIHRTGSRTDGQRRSR
jgi:hypothetical protein